MKTAPSVALAFSTLLLAFPCLGGTTNLLPGLTYYDGKEKMEGRLLFLAAAEALPPTNGLKRCFVYEFDLGRKRLSKVVETPASHYFGTLIVSADGGSYATFWPKQTASGPASFSLKDPHLLWFYSEKLRRSYTLSIPVMPQQWVRSRGHFFFDLDDRVLHFDIQTGTESYPEVSYFGKLKREGFGSITAEDFGERPEMKYKCFDGRFVWFAGEGSPVIGAELVSSAFADQQGQMLGDPDRKTLKLLKKFRESRVIANDLFQISPCRRYALVCQQRYGNSLSPTSYHKVRTYYVVHVSSGETWALLKDDVERKTRGYMSEIRWVPSRTGPH